MKERLKARKDKRKKERRDLSHHFVRPSQNLSVVAMETSLSDKGHACVTGRVKSSIDKPTRRRSYRIEVLINELRQFISTLGVDKCSIIGHDLGGLLGWFMKILHSNIIDKFVALSSPQPNLYWDELCKNNSFYRVLHTLHGMACSREKRVK
ncbi:hypothetical protein KQX54_018939 [Cotesia glomerata]|uniref:AB hydrolase-1 domain-containing protein n=1 Tax=Cotesia glomerata TaxID=32391 RepID=A0AAV7I4H0_COTGL|nr:hypothetical protein KQX54_018939 [Cotesia glomerata]